MDSQSRPTNRRRARRTFRKLGFEPLGTRVVLSAGALGGPLVEWFGPVDGNVTATLTSKAMPDTELDSAVRASMVSSFRGDQPWDRESFGHATRFDALESNAGHYETWTAMTPLVGQRTNVTLDVASQSTTWFATNLVFGPATVLTIIVGGPPASSLVLPVSFSRDTMNPPRDSAPMAYAGYSDRWNALAALQSIERPVSLPPQMSAGQLGDGAGLNPLGLAGWLTSTLQANSGRTSSLPESVWSPADASHSAKQPGSMAMAPHSWESLHGDRESGLIELDATLPKRKWRLLEEDDAEHNSERAAEIHLDRLMQSAWEEIALAWDAIGDYAKHAEAATSDPNRIPPDAAIVVKQTQIDLAADLIELTVEGPVAAASPRAPLPELATSDDQKVRIDAGVALYHDFEMATAPDAAPPAVKTGAAETGAAATGDATSASEAKSEKSAKQQPTSAALIGAGLLVSLPFSLRPIRQRDEKQAAEQARWHFERLD